MGETLLYPARNDKTTTLDGFDIPEFCFEMDTPLYLCIL